MSITVSSTRFALRICSTDLTRLIDLRDDERIETERDEYHSQLDTLRSQLDELRKEAEDILAARCRRAAAILESMQVQKD